VEENIKERIGRLQQEANQIAVQVLNSHPQYQNIVGRIQELQDMLEPVPPEPAMSPEEEAHNEV